MTASSKSVIKQLFMSGDRPTQADFGDLIDSYADVSSSVTSITGEVTATINNGVATTTIGSAAVTTSKLEGRAVSLAKLGFGTVGNILYYAASGVPTLLAAGTSGQVLTMGASIPAWSSAATQIGYSNGGFATNRFYNGIGYADQSNTLVVSTDTLYCKPFICGATTTFTRIGIDVTSGVAGSARLGIYNWANGAPTTLVADLGTVNTTTTGDKEITISQALTGGQVYGLAVVFDAGPTVGVCTEVASILGDLIGMGSSTGAVSLSVSKAHTFGALPAPFGTPSYGTGVMPQIWLRVV